MILSPARLPLATGCLIGVAILVAEVVILLAMGRPLLCTCGHLSWWYGNPSGVETSQHLSDWYSFTHVIHGFGLYALLWLLAPRTSIGLRLVLALGLEGAWEVVENTPYIIDRYRQAGLALGYTGDSIVNSITDTAAAALGFVLARTAPVWASAVLVIFLEVSLAYAIRDNFTLSFLQLVSPSDLITGWQTVK
jgi:hypothetical protein